MVGWNHDLLSRLIAPGIADMKTAEIPNVAAEFPELRYWIANHFLNSVFGTNFQGKSRILIFNIIYRAQNCLVEFDEARNETFDFIAGSSSSNPATGRYFRALSHWETSIFNHAIAVNALKALIQTNLFNRDDGSAIQRAYDFHNSIKHYGEMLTTVDVPADCDLIPAPGNEPAVIPLWLSGSGLHSGAHHLSFDEYAKCVRNLADVASRLTNPASFIAELQEYRRTQEQSQEPSSAIE